MKYFLSILGIVGSFVLIRYREPLGDMMGDNSFVHKIGGPYVAIVFIAIFVFFWSIAALTNTTEVLFAPVTWILPGMRQGPEAVTDF